MKLPDFCNLEGKCFFKVQFYNPSQMCVAYISYFGGWLSFDEKNARLLASFNHNIETLKTYAILSCPKMLECIFRLILILLNISVFRYCISVRYWHIH